MFCVQTINNEAAIDTEKYSRTQNTRILIELSFSCRDEKQTGLSWETPTDLLTQQLNFFKQCNIWAINKQTTHFFAEIPQCWIRISIQKREKALIGERRTVKSFMES